jgi:hypothetical protein
VINLGEWENLTIIEGINCVVIRSLKFICAFYVTWRCRLHRLTRAACDVAYWLALCCQYE